MNPTRVVLYTVSPAAWGHASSDISALHSLLMLVVLIKDRHIASMLCGGPVCTVHFKIG